MDFADQLEEMDVGLQAPAAAAATPAMEAEMQKLQAMKDQLQQEIQVQAGFHQILRSGMFYTHKKPWTVDFVWVDTRAQQVFGFLRNRPIVWLVLLRSLHIAGQTGKRGQAADVVADIPAGIGEVRHLTNALLTLVCR